MVAGEQRAAEEERRKKLPNRGASSGLSPSIPASNRLGPCAWLMLAIIATETLVAVKFGPRLLAGGDGDGKESLPRSAKRAASWGPRGSASCGGGGKATISLLVDEASAAAVRGGAPFFFGAAARSRRTASRLCPRRSRERHVESALLSFDALARREGEGIAPGLLEGGLAREDNVAIELEFLPPKRSNASSLAHALSSPSPRLPSGASLYRGGERHPFHHRPRVEEAQGARESHPFGAFKWQHLLVGLCSLSRSLRLKSCSQLNLFFPQKNTDG